MVIGTKAYTNRCANAGVAIREVTDLSRFLAVVGGKTRVCGTFGLSSVLARNRTRQAVIDLVAADRLAESRGPHPPDRAGHRRFAARKAVAGARRHHVAR